MRGAVEHFFAAGCDGVCLAEKLVILFFDVVLGCAFVNRACAGSAEHCLCVVGLSVITVFAAFAAMINAVLHIDTRAVAIQRVCRA